VERAESELIEAARAILRKRARPAIHFIGAALRTRSGRVYCGVNLGTIVGRASVCAEAVALGMAAAAGDTDVDCMVAVNEAGGVVSPCGICREMLSDYAPDARVIVPAEPAPRIVPLAELLPNKFVRLGR